MFERSDENTALFYLLPQCFQMLRGHVHKVARLFAHKVKGFPHPLLTIFIKFYVDLCQIVNMFISFVTSPTSKKCDQGKKKHQNNKNSVSIRIYYRIPSLKKGKKKKLGDDAFFKTFRKCL